MRRIWENFGGTSKLGESIQNVNLKEISEQL